ncbi:Response regulator PleD [Shimia sp. SK013]|uniref:diguanylate cyclase n=1 Tax=Shimia sp. SK013 TaxID=1389006 RepID=UPI0006B4B1B2|nr:diguanylate cyclase [Shimia sp. SK013]KPA21914.1 Response regulator PleD [Shimia sp. SK013]
MTGHLLIVDSIASNRCVLKARLSGSFMDTRQAETGQEALEMIRSEPPDLVILGGDLTDMVRDDFCRTVKTSADGAALPIIVTGSDFSRIDRLAALRAGADDIITSPISEGPFLARIRCLQRAHDTVHGLRLQETAKRIPGLAEDSSAFDAPAALVFAARDGADALKWCRRLKPLVPYRMRADSICDAVRTMSHFAVPDGFVIGVSADTLEEGLRFLAEIRARAATRQAAVLMVLDREDDSARVNALDLGANDVMVGSFDPEEAALRLAVILKRKKLMDRMSRSLEAGLNAAVTDPLTGLHNRRYALPQLARTAHKARLQGQDFAVMVADLDHFKLVNDKFGHAAGDIVLAEVARRLRATVEAGDLIARIGGEEFLIVMQRATPESASELAHHLRDVVRKTPVYLRDRDLRIPVTISIGVTMGSESESDHFQAEAMPSNDATATTLIDLADQALYGAKACGRNNVTMARPAA